MKIRPAASSGDVVLVLDEGVADIFHVDVPSCSVSVSLRTLIEMLASIAAGNPGAFGGDEERAGIVMELVKLAGAIAESTTVNLDSESVAYLLGVRELARALGGGRPPGEALVEAAEAIRAAARVFEGGGRR